MSSQGHQLIYGASPEIEARLSTGCPGRESDMPAMIRPTHLAGVLFDVDGTLVDTTYLHAVTWWKALRGAGLDVPMASIHRAVGMGSDKILAALLGDGRD